MSYLSLFLVSLAAATVLPFYSEVLLVSLLLAGHPAAALWAVATAGNTLGAVVNWALGRWALRFQDRRWFPVTPAQLRRAQARFQRYGAWTLLLTWAPVGGDALTVIAGVMRVRLSLFVLLVAIGKGWRYAMVIWLTPGSYEWLMGLTGA